MKPLDRPTLIDKPPAQIIQKLRMRWQLSLPSEITRGIDEPTSEMVFPNAVNHHPSDQVLGLCGHRLGQFITATTRVPFLLSLWLC